MKKLLKDNLKLIIIASFAYIYTVIVLITPSGFKALVPGELNDINNLYEIEDVTFNENIKTVSVYSWKEVTVFQKWLIENNDRYDLTEQTYGDKTKTIFEYNKQGKISRNSAIDSSIITAYYFASLKDNNITIDYNLKSLTIYDTNNKIFKIGDEIIKINNVEVKNYLNPKDLLGPIGLYNSEEELLIFANNNEYNLTILRNNDLIELTFKDLDKLVFFPSFEYETTPKINVNITDNVGGSSGGMMQTLSIYSALLNINYGNNKIAGTGTINVDLLHSVGEIGGIGQKVIVVKESNFDYFIVPESQYHLIEKYEEDLNIIKVNNFLDVIEKFVNVVGDFND